LKSKIRVLPHGVDTGFYTPPNKKSWERSTKNILYLGNFQHYPNMDAVKNFISHCGDRILAGSPGCKVLCNWVQSTSRTAGFEKRKCDCQGRGDDENMRRCYWNSDVFVAPIEWGTGFRGKLLEAMACGLPVVATQLATLGINPTNGEDMFVADDYDVFPSM
jgi:glycosyltransferase involved in cell wall biosynthesis